MNGKTDPRLFTFWGPRRLLSYAELIVLEWGWRSWIVKQMKLGWDGSTEGKKTEASTE